MVSPSVSVRNRTRLVEVLYTDYLVLGMRIDTWQVPSAMVKLHTDAEVRHIMQTQNKERLNRYEVAEIKERIRLEMKRKTLPMTKCVEMVWHLEEGWVKFFSQSQKLLGEFVDLFEETFQLRLKPHGPLVSATRGRFDHLALEEDSLIDLNQSHLLIMKRCMSLLWRGNDGLFEKINRTSFRSSFHLSLVLDGND